MEDTASDFSNNCEESCETTNQMAEDDWENGENAFANWLHASNKVITKEITRPAEFPITSTDAAARKSSIIGDNSEEAEEDQHESESSQELLSETEEYSEVVSENEEDQEEVTDDKFLAQAVDLLGSRSMRAEELYYAYESQYGTYQNGLVLLQESRDLFMVDGDGFLTVQPQQKQNFFPIPLVPEEQVKFVVNILIERGPSLALLQLHEIFQRKHGKLLSKDILTVLQANPSIFTVKKMMSGIFQGMYVVCFTSSVAALLQSTERVKGISLVMERMKLPVRPVDFVSLAWLLLLVDFIHFTKMKHIFRIDIAMNLRYNQNISIAPHELRLCLQLLSRFNELFETEWVVQKTEAEVLYFQLGCLTKKTKSDMDTTLTARALRVVKLFLTQNDRREMAKVCGEMMKGEMTVDRLVDFWCEFETSPAMREAYLKGRAKEIEEQMKDKAREEEVRR